MRSLALLLFLPPRLAHSRLASALLVLHGYQGAV